jgi:hypothetical protein
MFADFAQWKCDVFRVTTTDPADTPAASRVKPIADMK